MAPALSPGRGGFAASWRRELRSLRGNRADLLLVTLLPLLMLAVMAWMFTPSVMRDVPIAVVDLDHSSDSRLLLRMLDASPGVRIASQPADMQDARSQLRRLDVFAIVLVPRDVTRQALRGRQGTVFAYYNATYMTTGQSAARDIGDAVSAWNARLLRERIGLQVGPGKLRAAPIAVQSDIMYNPARSYELFLLPLIFPAVLSLVLALAVAGSLGREIRDGSLPAWLGAELKVHEGDRVQAGQVLFLLDSPEVAAKEQQAHGALAAAQAVADKADEGARSEDIRAAEANWKRAEAGATLAEATYQRVQNLFNEGVMTRQKRDEAQTQATSSRELARAARAQYDMALAGAREQDKRAAQGQVQQAQGAVAEVNAARAEVEGRAPVAGEINKRMADPGELVPAGYPVFTLVDIDRMWVAMNLRESQMQGLKVGSKLQGNVPALGLDGEFEVYFINPAGDYATWRTTRQSSGYDVRSFEVRVRPVRRIEGFRPGMSVLFAWPQH